MPGSTRGNHTTGSSAAGLVARARAGEATAWAALYENVTGRLLVWLRARPMSDHALSAEDIVAESWLIAAERIHDFNGDESDFPGWLFGIARKLMANAQRRASRRSTNPTDFSELDIYGRIEGHESAYAGADWVRRTLATLPAREAEVLTCTEVVGLDTAATALALDINPTAVRVARHRGLTRLRREAATHPELTLIAPRVVQSSSAIAASPTR